MINSIKNFNNIKDRKMKKKILNEKKETKCELNYTFSNELDKKIADLKKKFFAEQDSEIFKELMQMKKECDEKLFQSLL